MFFKPTQKSNDLNRVFGKIINIKVDNNNSLILNENLIREEVNQQQEIIYGMEK